MSVMDDLQSPMTIESSLRYQTCIKCGKVEQLSFEELAEKLLGELPYQCRICEEKNATRRKSQTR